MMSQYTPNTPTVAIITSTIGRPELERAIVSVQYQSYPATHYVFVDGEQYWQQARGILEKYPNVVVTYLPMNTGAKGWTNSSINAIAPYLVKADIICYLDDDNWYEPHHIMAGVQTLQATGADYAYALRNMYDENNQFVCIDTFESLGSYQRGWQSFFEFYITANTYQYPFQLNLSNHQHIDTNCYLVRHKTAKLLSQTWHTGLRNDYNVYQWLRQFATGVCTKQTSVNYVVDLKKFMGEFLKIFQQPPIHATPEQADMMGWELLRQMSQASIDGWGGRLIWELDQPNNTNKQPINRQIDNQAIH